MNIPTQPVDESPSLRPNSLSQCCKALGLHYGLRGWVRHEGIGVPGWGVSGNTAKMRCTTGLQNMYSLKYRQLKVGPKDTNMR